MELSKQDLKQGTGGSFKNSNKKVTWNKRRVIAVEMDNFEWMNLKYVPDTVKYVFLFEPYNNLVM